MILRLPCNIKSIFLSLLLLFVFTITAFSQKKIHGVINDYGRVSSIGTDFVIISDETEFSKFHERDTILLIQMKGVKSLVAEGGTYGDHQNSLGKPGAYQFMIILSVDDPTNTITFANNILNPSDYNVLGDVQIVRVPSFYSATVDGLLTCSPWDPITKTGGILTMIVGTKLTLNNNISVNGKGFKGGTPVNTLSALCIASDPINNDKYSYPDSYTNSGNKGEGHVTTGYVDGTHEYPIFPDYARGKGANYTAGGGGNGHFSGGGGGSLRGSGGFGGDERSGVCVPETGALGGKQAIVSKFPQNLLYFGGGGGGSTYFTGSTSSPGGNGGGIIIILCETLDGNGYSISSDGETPVQSFGDAGSGGGGAGGTVAIYLQGFPSTPLTISAKGGKGGNSDPAHTGGTGGGGGGGIVTTSISIPANVTRSIAGGTAGTRSGIVDGATPGTIGESLETFVPILNGFLFNTIKSSVTLNNADSICSNIIPKPIFGTNPVGGSGSYTYKWQKTYDLTVGPTDILSSNVRDYTPTVLESATDSVYFRRIVTDDVSSLTDQSKWVAIKIQPEITNNNIGIDNIICYNQDPIALVSSGGPPANGNDIYFYRWIKNSDNSNWVASPDTLGVGFSESYDPPALTSTTYYRRRVISGRCISYTSTVTIDVLPSITGNVLSSPPDAIICEGSKFNAITATAVGGGDLTYKYQWEDRTFAGAWALAPGTNNAAAYQPDTAVFTTANEKRYIRRIVYSGAGDVCSSISDPVLLTRYHKIKNNNISADQVICESTQPQILTGTQPIAGAGPGSYTYAWQESIDGAVWTQKSVSADYLPSTLAVSTWYRRKVESSVCENISAPVKMTVQPAIRNNNINLLSGLTDSTICAGGQPYKIVPKAAPALTGGTGSGYTYRWKTSADNISWNDIPATTTAYYQPPVLNSTAWYRRVVISASGICKDSANNIRIAVLPPIINTIPADNAVCINTPSSPISGLTLSGGQTGDYRFMWQDSTAGHSWANVTSQTNADLQLPLLSNPVKYRRQVWSGPNNTCFSVSKAVKVSITSLPYPVIAGKDTILNSFEFLYKLQAEVPVLGTGTWSVVSSQGTPSFDDASVNNTTVRNLSPGLNTLMWKMVNGVCELSSQVKIEIVNLSIPSGISPDGNGKNDFFNIKGLDFSIDAVSGLPNQDIELTILNSAGALVYYTSNTQGNDWSPWYGKNSEGADLPEGTYYYLLKISSNRNENIIKKSGFILLKRY